MPLGSALTLLYTLQPVGQATPHCGVEGVAPEHVGAESSVGLK